MEKKYRDSKDTALVSGQITDIPSESEEREEDLRFSARSMESPYPPTIFRNDVPSRTATLSAFCSPPAREQTAPQPWVFPAKVRRHTLSFYSGLSNPAPLHNMEGKPESRIPAPAEEPLHFPRPSETCSLTGHPLFTREFGYAAPCRIGPDGKRI